MTQLFGIYDVQGTNALRVETCWTAKPSSDPKAGSLQPESHRGINQQV